MTRIQLKEPNEPGARVKCASLQFSNDSFSIGRTVMKCARRIEWSKIGFSHSLALEPTAVGAFSSAVAGVKPLGAMPLYGVHVAGGRRWFSFPH